jgi:hypothetical protein
MGKPSKESDLPNIGLKRVDGYAGGTKKMENPVYLAGVNYLDTEKLVDWFEKYLWIDPAILVIQTEGATPVVFSSAGCP